MVQLFHVFDTDGDPARTPFAYHGQKKCPTSEQIEDVEFSLEEDKRCLKERRSNAFRETEFPLRP